MTDKKKGIVITAMVCLTVLELAALYQGINGSLFTIIVAAVAGLAGWVLPTPKLLKQNGK